MANDNTSVSHVHATVAVRNSSLPPELSFSFPGLHEPTELWAQLEELGWNIPEIPIAPDPVIDWTSPGGSEYSVLPYVVEGFRVTAKKWPATEIAERSLNTINMLRRSGIDLQIPIAYLDFLRRTQVAIMKRSELGRSKPPQPAAIPNTLLLSRQPWSILVDEPNIELFNTASAPNQPTWIWSESNRQVGELCSSTAERSELLDTVDMGWELMSRMEAPVAVDGRDRILRFIVQDVRDGSDMLRRLQGLVDDNCASMLMQPVRSTRAVDKCLLIIAVVPKERFAEIGQQMINEFPDAIGRGKRYSAPVEAAEDTAA